MERYNGIEYYSSIDEIPSDRELGFMTEYIRCSYSSNTIAKLGSKFSKLKILVSEGDSDNALIEINNMMTAYNDVLNSKNNVVDCFAHLVDNVKGNTNLIDIKSHLNKLPTQKLMMIINQVKKNLMLRVN